VWSGDWFHRDTSFYISVYVGLNALQTVASLRSAVVIWAGMRASRRMHRALLDNIIHLPMQFFEQTPVGRVLQRYVCLSPSAIEGSSASSRCVDAHHPHRG
jgi:ABC-type multidrug transport system fused ATPase/permease subunit